MELDIYMALQFICRVVTWSQSHPCPRGGIVAGNLSTSVPAAISGEGRLVKTSLIIDAVLINSRAERPPPCNSVASLYHRGMQVRLALCTRGRCENDCKVFKVACVRASTSVNFLQSNVAYLKCF